MKDYFSGGIVDVKLLNFNKSSPDNGIHVPAELGIFSQMTYEHDDICRLDGPELNFGNGACSSLISCQS
jgi:hypothetical protein